MENLLNRVKGLFLEVLQFPDPTPLNLTTSNTAGNNLTPRIIKL